ncbi:MAG: hypothetical protein COA79_25935 [Planctomycetota bacterium]|nr:MAG: hypothetical protein COA79_25935 [Planctomycetota bacterium]
MGLKVTRYIDGVATRLKQNNDQLDVKSPFRYVALGDEIFPIKRELVNEFYDSSRGYKRRLKKEWEKSEKKRLKREANTVVSVYLELTADIHPNKNSGATFPLDIIKKGETILAERHPHNHYRYRIGDIDCFLPSEFVKEVSKPKENVKKKEQKSKTKKVKLTKPAIKAKAKPEKSNPKAAKGAK